MTLSKTICPLPWIQFSVSTDTSLRFCCCTDYGGAICHNDGSKIYLDQISHIDQVVNLSFLKKLRRDMMQGQRPTCCNACYSLEDNGGISLRQTHLKQWEKELTNVLEQTQQDGTVIPNIHIMDLSLSNHCNLQCRMCNPESSIQLETVFQQENLPYRTEWTNLANTGWQQTPQLENLILSILTLNKIKLIQTTGGEPFISPLHRWILNKAIDLKVASQIRLAYNTNLTVLPPQLLQLWPHFKQIELHISIEGIQEINDYIRYPSLWGQIVGNLETLTTLKQKLPLRMEVHTCFQAYNLFALPSLFDFLHSYAIDFPSIPYLIWLHHPQHVSATALPPSLRQEACNMLTQWLHQNEQRYQKTRYCHFELQSIQNLKAYINRLLSLPFTEADWIKFWEYTDNLDQRRKQNIEAIIPQLKRNAR